MTLYRIIINIIVYVFNFHTSQAVRKYFNNEYSQFTV